MKEKLNRFDFEKLWETSNIPGMDKLWARIESDREAVREEVINEIMTPPFLNKKENEAYHKWAIDQVRSEVREEIRKDHFRIGEEAESFQHGEWRKGIIAVTDVLRANPNVRRPPKTRQMNHGELVVLATENGILGPKALGWHFAPML